MSLSGSFDTMPLCDLMQWVHSSNKTGTLSISYDLDNTYLVFRDGVLIAIGCDEAPRLDSGQMLLARNRITEPQLEQLAVGCVSAADMDTALLNSGVIGEDELAAMQKEQVFEIVLDLFFQDEGSFLFSLSAESGGVMSPLELPHIHFLKKAISTQELLFEGIHRLDEWSRIREVFPNSYVVVSAREGNSKNPVYLELKQVARTISVGELLVRMGGSRYFVYQQLYKAYQLGLVEQDLKPVRQANQQNLSPVDMLLENARILIAEKQFDEARVTLVTATNMDPGNTVARSLLQNLQSTQLEYLYQQMQPHRIPLLTVPVSEIEKYGLDHREKHLASRLNGNWDVATLVVATPIGELETLRILRKLLHAGLVRFQG